MWLSKTKIPDSLDRYAIHQYIWAMFNTDSTERPFIFHINDDGFVVVLSTIKPEVDCVELDYNKITGCIPFSLIVNPTKRDIKTRKIEAIFDINDRREWLKRKLVGCELKYCNNSQKLEKVKSRGKTVFIDRIDGIIEIKNKDEFLRFLCHGIGRSKFFGCGMIYLPTIMG